MKHYQDITDPSLAKALAHPLRTRILAALEDRTASPSELADELGASLGVVSYHVRRLAALRFLKLVKRVPRRGAVEHYYTAVARQRISDDAWGATPTIVKRAAIGAALEEIGSSVNDAASAGGFDRADMHLSRSAVLVDERGWKALSGELETLLGRIEKIETESRKRLERGDHQEERKATMVMMLFDTPAAKPVAASGDGKPARRRSSRRTLAHARD